MPRATQSKIGGIVAFFRSASMEVAEAVMDMAKDAIRERKDKSEVIKAAQLKAKRKADKKDAPAPAAKTDKPKPRKRHRNRSRAAQATDQSTPVEVPPEADQDLLADPD